ncbi:MAG TPA: zf-HC2 domain-containing protein [Acidimicrobiales bacterium]|nr:zf-HC2 domain-containing protein [Acidimicrobiales bacterium]
MTGDPMPEACRQLQGALAEVALGIASGRERAAVLEHLESCARCRSEEEQLSSVADGLLGLAPEVEPPVGFEVRLFERAGVRPPARRLLQGWRGAGSRAGWRGAGSLRRAAAAAVLAVAVLAGVGIGRAALPTTTSARPAAGWPAQAAVATLKAGSRDVGQVASFPGNPAWLFMTVADLGSASRVECRLTLHDGRTMAVGSFRLSGGYGAWGVALPVPRSQVATAKLVGPQGAVLASASFRF